MSKLKRMNVFGRIDKSIDKIDHKLISLQSLDSPMIGPKCGKECLKFKDDVKYNYMTHAYPDFGFEDPLHFELQEDVES